MSQWLLDRLMLVIPLVLSLTVHEWAHAWAASKLGDDTARLLGRLTLDPLAHIDPVGSLLLPMLGIPIGWAKPVPVNPARFRGVSLGTGLALTAAAGPLSNLVLAAICGGVLALLGVVPLPAGLSDALTELLQIGVFLNVALAVFNLLPIPPLDGSRIVEGWLPKSLRAMWDPFAAIAPFILVAALIALTLWTVPMEWMALFDAR